MADVFLARDQLLDRPVAVKVLFPQYASEPSFVERFRREAQAAASLNHPSIVAVYDSGEHDNTYFIVMEYVEGRSLAEVIRAEAPLYPDRAAEIVTDVAAALGFAHRNGMVHRDVKPGNILITPTGQVKVTDFGIARAFGATNEELTQVGSVMGTATYFSPEQAQGLPVDPRSDLYSLGVVLYEMVTGRPPFTGDSAVATAYKHVRETPPRPASINPDIPPALEAIIARLLAKNPSSRYASAEDLRADLRRYREGRPLVGAGTGVTPAVQASMDSAGGEPTAAVAVVAPTTTNRAVIETTQAVPVGTYVTDDGGSAGRGNMFFVGVGVLLLAVIGLLYYVSTLVGNTDGEGAVELRTVPAVINQPAAEAAALLQQAGFVPVQEFEENENYEPGLVFDQNPGANTEAEFNSEVTIFVSKAAEVVTIPNLEGWSEQDATAQLAELDLEVSPDSEASDDVPEGDVISLSPEPGTEVNVGTVVTLVISTGPARVEVPNLAGMTVPEATNVLGQNGLGLPDIVREPSASVAEGLVISTDPPAGTPVSADRSITLTVSDGPETALVPTLIGLTQAAAEQALANKGFIPRVEFIDAPAGSDDGTVVSQNPAPNERLTVGSEVVIGVLRAVEETTTTTEATTTTTEATTTSAESTTTEADGG